MGCMYVKIEVETGLRKELELFFVSDRGMKFTVRAFGASRRGCFRN